MQKENGKLDREQIYNLTTLVAGRFSLQEVLDRLAEAAVRITSVKACSIRLLDQATGQLQMQNTYGLSERYRRKGPVTMDDPVIREAFSGEAVVVDDMRVDGRIRYRSETIEEGLVSQLTVAMQFKDQPIGVLRLYSPQSRRFGPEDITLARAIASQCAVAITNARLYAEAIQGSRMAEQVRLAGMVQRRMIPESAPLVPGLDIAGKYIPSADVGGDFYDFLRIGDMSVAVAIADVIGKGMPAALMMSMFRGAMRAYADTWCGVHNLSQLVRKLNITACEQCRTEEFITLFYAIIDVEKRAVTYCNCGHEPAVLLAAGRAVELDRGGLVLGVDPAAKYDIGTVELADGDCLLFYTDGLVDAANFQGDLWGHERLEKIALQLVDGSAGNMVGNILKHRRSFTGLARQVDDTSIVVVKLDTRAEPVFQRRGGL